MDINYQKLLQQDIDNLTPSQFLSMQGILNDLPVIKTDYGAVAIGDIAAEQYAGLTGPAQTPFAREMNEWLPQSSAYLKQAAEIV